MRRLASCIFSAILRRRPITFTGSMPLRSASAEPVRRAPAAGTSTASRSSCVTRPSGPVPRLVDRSMPSFCARARTAGDACAWPHSCTAALATARLATRDALATARALRRAAAARCGARLHRGLHFGPSAAPAGTLMRGFGCAACGRAVGLRGGVGGRRRAAARRRRCRARARRLRSPSVSNTAMAAADGRHVAGLAVKRHDLAGDGRGHLHRRFVGHHVDERRVFLDDVADAHVPGDDLGFGRAFADIRQFENELAHGPQASITRRIALMMRGGVGKYSHSRQCG